MSFDWEHYLDLARILVTQHNAGMDREAELRCAIKRVYLSVPPGLLVSGTTILWLVRRPNRRANSTICSIVACA